MPSWTTTTHWNSTGFPCNGIVHVRLAWWSYVCDLLLLARHFVSSAFVVVVVAAVLLVAAAAFVLDVVVLKTSW